MNEWFFDWALLNSRTLHPNIGIPVSSAVVPYLSQPYTMPLDGSIGNGSGQTYGLLVGIASPPDSITGYLFTSTKRLILGNGAALDLYNNGAFPQGLALDGIHNHIFGPTYSGFLNNVIEVNGAMLGWTGGQYAPQNTIPGEGVTLFNYMGSNYFGMGNVSSDYVIAKPGGILDTYPVSSYTFSSSPVNLPKYGLCELYTTYGGSNPYGFISPEFNIGQSINPLVQPYLAPECQLISYSFSFPPIYLVPAADTSGYSLGFNGIGDIVNSNDFITTGIPLDSRDVYGFDPISGALLALSPNIYTDPNSGIDYYPVYVYNAFEIPKIPYYFNMQRHYAYNYSRGVPINQGTQNLILPPNRNIIL